jgi:hypothetical protein
VHGVREQAKPLPPLREGEADEIVGLMLARLLERRGYRVTLKGLHR